MFVFDQNYDNNEQVRPFFADYMVIYRELEAAGKYPYNASLKGRVPGIEGDDEDTAIYLLQRLRDLDALKLQISDFKASGGVEVTELAETIRGTVVVYGFYMGGSGWRQYDHARLVPRHGRPHAILPKGARTRGHLVDGHVMVKAS